MLMQHPEREVEPCQRSFGVHESHVEQVRTEVVQDGVEGDPVVKRSGVNVPKKNSL
jgi:hypothetical protein